MAERPILFLSPRPLAKAASIPDGSRWITVHPNGPGTDGQPVLIQPNEDGTAHVIGGAGGKLNYLKLRGVKKESDYQAEAAQKKKAESEARKVQAKQDREAGIAEKKKQAKLDVARQRREHERKFVKTVADAMGWEPKSLEFPEEQYQNVSEAARNKAAGEHHRAIMQRASEAVEIQRQRLVADHAARMEAGIGEVPLDASDPDVLSVQDLDPTPSGAGESGLSHHFKERAEQAGLTDEELKKEATPIKEARLAQLTDDQRKAAIARGETAKLVKDELQGIREPVAPKNDAALADARQAAAVLRAAKQLKQIQQKAREMNAAIDKSNVEPKAYVLEYTADPEADSKIAQDLSNDLRTAQTRAFLSEFNRLAGEKPQETLGKHIGVGAYNSINSLALAVGGQALVDRSVVDVLGIAGAAQVLARRIIGDLPEQAERIAEGVQEFHLHHYMEASADAMGRAQELMDAAKEIELGEAENGSDLQVAQEMNARRRRAVVEAQKILGQTLGEMEANAALTVAMKQGKKDQFQVSLGKRSIEAAITQARAIGLQRGDYRIDTTAGNTFLTVTGAGLDRLAKPIDRADIAQVQRNLSIIRGDLDEDDWLPLGVARRPDLAMDVKPGIAPRLAEPFEAGSNLDQSLRDYIGGRAADGDTPADIVADIQSAEFFDKVGDARAREYRAALDAVAPLNDGRGKPRRAESLSADFDRYADEFVRGRHGGERSAINRQQFEVSDAAVDALHRALAKTPEGTAAYKQIGELTAQDQRALREFFQRNVAKESPAVGEMRRELESHSAAQPEKTVQDMFGEDAANPAWEDWRARRDELASRFGAASLDWSKYVDAMHGNEQAYESIQDLIRSRVSKDFADSHNRLRPGAPVKLGRSVIRNNLNHLDTVDPEAREERMARERALTDSLRERARGRYAAGAVSDKLDAAREKNAALEQSQMGFFSAEQEPDKTTGGAGAPALAGDERYTIGHEAERQLAGMMGVVGQNFKPGRPLRLWEPTMSGGKNAARQRLVKLVDANKRVVAAFGTGSGKSLLGLASFTHLHEQGKVKRGLFLVPSIVQGQFAGEALRYLQPGKYKWNIEPGASREARIAAHRDASNNFAVMTHQSFRDDMVHLGAKHAGIGEPEMASRLAAMSPDERKDWMRGTLDREGIKYDYLNVDEGQNVLNRAGKENSELANVVDALSHPDITPYYVTASGDPVKNDASEVFDLLRKMDPARYQDRDEFMRRYGPDTLSSKDALRREMARYIFPSKIDPDVHADRKESKIALSAGQRQSLAELESNFTKARIARIQGKVDVDAMRAIAPHAFDGVPQEQHEARARELQQSLGIMKSSAVMRTIMEHPDNPIADDLLAKAAERKGKPGVVFAHSLKAVQMLADRLAKAGHRVVTITGKDGPKEKERKRLMFRPEQGEAQADILVASDAGAVGMNVQRGQWLYQADTPMTAMTHNQRNGRVFRTGQENDVELIDAVPDHPEVHRARDRLAKKYALRELTTSSLDGLDETGIAQFLRERQVRQQDSQSALL